MCEVWRSGFHRLFLHAHSPLSLATLLKGSHSFECALFEQLSELVTGFLVQDKGLWRPSQEPECSSIQHLELAAFPNWINAASVTALRL
jgi:hypothetical protein